MDLRTVRRLAPAVILEGRLAAAGTLDGPLHNVTFRGTATQRDGDRPPSTATGTLYLDTRSDSLSHGDRRDLRSALVRGDSARLSHAQGPGRAARAASGARARLSHMSVDADLRGDLGDVTARGT